jgi:hypothetical protein
MKIDGNTPVNVTLNLEQLNVVLTSLGTQPYDRVAPIVASVQQQVTQQINALQAPPAPPAPPVPPADKPE